MLFWKRMRRPLRKYKPVERLLFGGSFDPPHRGHLAMVRFALQQGLCDDLDICPAALSPFKTLSPPASAAERKRMLELALGDIALEIDEHRDRIRILDLELQRGGPSFTAQTLRDLRLEFPDTRIGLLLGSDSFLSLERWRNFQDILFHHTLLVFRRSEDRQEMLQNTARRFKHQYSNCGPEIRILDNPLVEASSRETRAALAEGLESPALSRMLSPAVLQHIRQQGLYRAAAGDRRSA
ncbi:MAG: nicotinate (nicotinamide) nucleotide adenylyltransferase [Leptospirales bacterium]|nr:nicotinate (nicotinamide) nucleotide adenylyltransferase [Leptospirales bacterium]